MIRWLLIILFIYLLVKLFRGSKNRRKRKIRFRFGDFDSGNFGGGQNSGKRRIEEIEDAEFEDITDKVNKEDNS
ncbi:MAG: hypothetical protein GVY02_01235 [Bacteroidetes bacterium]|jgi:hypothetical protein|nr:hypothetical protein [Bacteroidota bacterium]